MIFTAYYRAGPDRYQERFGLDFEDFSAGQRFRHRPGVTLSQQDNTDEALDTMNAAMLHFDAHYAAQTTWQKPLMVSTITVQRVIGMATKTFGRRKAILGIGEIKLSGPLFGGDTLFAESEILALEPGDDPDCGVVTSVTRGLKPDGTVVCQLTARSAIWRQGRGPGAAIGEPVREPRFAAYSEAADGSLVEQVGLFFEDHRAGESFIHYPRRSVFRDEAIQHAWRSLELAPQYHDLAWLAQHEGGRYRIAEGFLIALATAPSTRVFGRVVANLGWTDIAFPQPVYAGDTIEAESTILDKRDSRSRPSEGILAVETRAYNQDRQLVLSYKRNLLVYRRDAETPYAKAGY